MVGLIVTTLAWKVLGATFLLPDDRHPGSMAVSDFHQRASTWRPKPVISPDGWLPAGLRDRFGTLPPQDPLFAVSLRIVEPFRRLFSVGGSWHSCFYFLIGGVLNVGIWSFCGAAITRSSVMHCGLHTRISLQETLVFAKEQCFAIFSAVILPLVGITLLAIPFIALGWLMTLDIGIFIAGLLWVFVLFAGCLMAVLGLGLMFGWPLMWGCICAEKSDAFDAISRSYAYTFQRPLHYLFYALIAAVLGTLGWLVVWWLSESAIALSYWSVELGSGAVRIEPLREFVDGARPIDELGGPMICGIRLIQLSNGAVRCLASAYAYSFFWSVSGAVYLLLRRDTDQTELDDVICQTPRITTPMASATASSVPSETT